VVGAQQVRRGVQHVGAQQVTAGVQQLGAGAQHPVGWQQRVLQQRTLGQRGLQQFLAWASLAQTEKTIVTASRQAMVVNFRSIFALLLSIGGFKNF
jgi:hypothetical protein